MYPLFPAILLLIAGVIAWVGILAFAAKALYDTHLSYTARRARRMKRELSVQRARSIAVARIHAKYHDPRDFV